MAGKHVILGTPTGSGKSLVALGLHFKALCEGRVSFYTSPIKALASEKFFALCDELGAENVGMRTGDAEHQPGGQGHLLHRRGAREHGPPGRRPSSTRPTWSWTSSTTTPTRSGLVAWQVPLLVLPRRSSCSCRRPWATCRRSPSGSTQRPGREVAFVTSEERPGAARLRVRGRRPSTRRSRSSWSRSPSAGLRRQLHPARVRRAGPGADEREDHHPRGARGDPRGRGATSALRHPLRQGVPALPLVRRRRPPRRAAAQVPAARRAALAAGAPPRHLRHRHARRRREHPDPHRPLHEAREVRRDARSASSPSATSSRSPGARGRKGFDDRGSVVAQAPEHIVEKKQATKKRASGKKSRRPSAGRPKGEVSWTEETFQRLITRPPETLKSRFHLTHGMVLDLLQRDAEIDDPSAGTSTRCASSSPLPRGRRDQARLLRHAAVLVRSLTGRDPRDVRDTTGSSGSSSPRTCSGTSPSTRRSRSTRGRPERLEPPRRPTRSTSSPSSSRSSRTPTSSCASRPTGRRESSWPSSRPRGPLRGAHGAKLEEVTHPKPLPTSSSAPSTSSASRTRGPAARRSEAQVDRPRDVRDASRASPTT
jgi:hypothetical protein